ncbi:hypothetical protein [Martelella soudanensis]|uniref:hypothetical protein n=1 Tax=unclassified Martelella TaxID=2629616 RepID=UPI0015E02AA1|nr:MULTISPECIES: hypothetical protein [unclassified Martelella]
MPIGVEPLCRFTPYPGAPRKVSIAGVPIKMEKTPGSVRSPAPLLGQHTREILQQMLNYNDFEIDALIAQGAIGDMTIPEIA